MAPPILRRDLLQPMNTQLRRPMQTHTTASMLDLDAISNASVTQTPYPHMVVKHVLSDDVIAHINRDFPPITQGGSFPLHELTCKAHFAALVAQMQSDALKDIIADKFHVDLTGRPAMLTVRGFSREKDGRIHTDSKSKLITALLYLNANWQETDSGNLRLLHNGTDIENYATEIPSTAGTLLIFKVTDHCWHGYKPFVGERRSIQLNYVIDETALGKQLSRHGLSAKLKHLKKRFFSK